jgi:hypothetical protein
MMMGDSILSSSHLPSFDLLMSTHSRMLPCRDASDDYNLIKLNERWSREFL